MTPKEFEDAYETYANAVLRAAVSFTPHFDRDQAADVCSQVWLELWERNLHDPIPLLTKSYLYQRAIWRVTDLIRDRLRHLQFRPGYDIPMRSNTLKRLALKQCLSRLAPHQRTAITLYLKGMSQPEIADALGVSDRTVRKRLSEAVGALRSM